MLTTIRRILYKNKPHEVFISYQRNDGPRMAVNICKAINDRLPYKAYIDINNSVRGAEFAKKLDAAVDLCKVHLVVFGKNFDYEKLSDEKNLFYCEVFKSIQERAKEKGGKPRLIIPILVDSVNVEDVKAKLPTKLQPIFNFEYGRVGYGEADFKHDIGKICNDIAEFIRDCPRPDDTLPRPDPRVVFFGLLAGVVIILSILLAIILVFDKNNESTQAQNLFPTLKYEYCADLLPTRLYAKYGQVLGVQKLLRYSRNLL